MPTLEGRIDLEMLRPKIVSFVGRTLFSQTIDLRADGNPHIGSIPHSQAR
jgi:hypothetical protein